MLKKKLSLIIALVITTLIIVFYLGDVLSKLNSAYFSFSGDGIKNYYTFEYHVEHDNSALHFEGMNYPEGEHVMFTDGFFPLSSLLKLIKPVIDLSDYSHGILNSILLLSLVLASFFLYKLLREFSVNEWVAAFFSPGLVFFSPLIQRLPGHFSLSIAFFIPVLMLMLVRYYKSPKWKYIMWSGVVVLLCSMAHLYHIALAGLLIGGFLLYVVLAERKKDTLWKSGFFFLGSVLIPYLIIFLMMYFSDSVHDRSAFPFGFMYYRSAWEGVFLNNSQIGIESLEQFFKVDVITWEGRAFIGHFADIGYLFIYGIFAAIPFLIHRHLGAFVVVLIVSVVLWFFFKRKRNILDLSGNRLINAFLWTGFLALFVSFATPVKIIPELYYHMGPIKELRGIGRMNWIFFFVVNIGVIVIIQRIFKKPVIKYIISALFIVSIFYNAERNCRTSLSRLGKNEEIGITRQIVNNSPFADNDFVASHNAIIGLPVVLIGSENITCVSQGERQMQFMFLASQKSGLPMASSIMSRTSIQQTIDKMDFFCGPYNHEIAYLNSLPDGNYAVVMDINTILYKRGEQLIKDNSDSIWSSSDYFVGSISKKKLLEIFTPQMPDSGGVDPTTALYWNDFSNLDSDEGYYTPGNSSLIKMEKPIQFLKIELPDSMQDRILEFSFWVSDIHQDAMLRTSCEIAFFNDKDSVIIYDYENFGKKLVQIDGDWAMYQRYFTIPVPVTRVEVSFIHNELNINSFIIDNVLIRDVNTTVYLENDKFIMQNNYFYPKKKK